MPQVDVTTELPVARVLQVDCGSVTLRSDGEPVRASLGSDLLCRIARDPTAAPSAGDWCRLRQWPDGPVTVEGVLGRRSSVVRVEPGGSARPQVLAANVDLVLVVVGLLPEPVLNRVERLLALAWGSGAAPVLVLTKADLVGDANLLAEDLRGVRPGVPVVVTSTRSGRGVTDLRALVGTGTAALIGSSGAGKSSLINCLAGADVLAAREIRADGRRRHTSAPCQLVELPGGGALIDTPGLRP